MDKHKRKYISKLFSNEKIQKSLIFIVTTVFLCITSYFEIGHHNNGVEETKLSMLIGIGIIVLLAEIIILLCINSYKKELLADNSNLALLSLILIVGTIISSSSEIISAYLIPVGFISMLISIIFGPLVALAVSIPYSAVLLCVTGFDSAFSVVYAIGCITGIIFARKTSARHSIILGGAVIGLTNGLAVFSIELLQNHNLVNSLMSSAIAMVGGILSSVFTIGFLPVFEQTFDINTPIRLLEISNPNQPLMKKLLFEAPGTYHHSILVGNLSETAAEVIGANSLLARVGAHYHDIGKIKRPYFFKENQISNDNPHDKITPKLSSIIITSHVKDGVELAQKNKLPKAIVRIIEEHHGNTLVKYFYSIAASSPEGEETEVDDTHFRYNGPRPSTKESGIVMLADSVEAAVRSMTGPTLNDIESMVTRIIKDKIDDGQLNECDLTMREIEQIKSAFVKVLGGMFHSRIEYPEFNDYPAEQASNEEIIDDRNQ